MKVQDRNRERAVADDDIRRIASLAAAMRVICMAHHLALRDQSLTVIRHPKTSVQIDFAGREPFGFAFTAGHEATFHVPSGHRFVIENMNVSCWAEKAQVDVQLVTKSRHMFRQMSLTCWPQRPSLQESAPPGAAAPILVNGSTANTFLFSNGEVHSSPTVPPDTYLQVWGYLEPAYEPEGL